jgi:hypothetical protein
MVWFDEGRVDDRHVLEQHDVRLRYLAESGARVRREFTYAGRPTHTAEPPSAPRAVVAVGSDARLLRAVLEPWCPVPFVAWPTHGLPGWVGALDLVVVLAPAGSDQVAAHSVAEAVRRGAQVLATCPERSVVAEHAQSRWTTQLMSSTEDSLAAAVTTLHYLHSLDLGPEVDAMQVADGLDVIARDCSPHQGIGNNPAKENAIAVAEATPLVWGGTVLAARAARRTAEALRAWTGRPALAAPAEQLLPVLESTQRRDLFADPVYDAADVAPALVIFDDGSQAAPVREERGRLLAAATDRGIRVVQLRSDASTEMGHYGELQLLGRYLAAYLALGMTEQSPLDD